MSRTNRIEKLSDEQAAKMTEWRDKWTAIGLSTELAQRAEAERGVMLAYAAAGKKPPEKIAWCGSPLSQGITRAIVLDLSSKKKVRASVGASVWASVGASVGDSVGDSVWDSVWDSVRDSVGASVRDSVRDSVWDSVGASVGASVWDSVWDSVGDSVGDSVRASVWASVRDSVRASVWASVRDSGYGQHDASWIAFYNFFREVCSLREQTERLQGLELITRSAGWFLPHEHICWISERHNVLNRDDRGRLHCENGPALAYPDGFQIHAWHGVRVNYRIVEHPLDLTVKEIQSEQNAEVRRVMMERYGLPRYIVDSGAAMVHEDEMGQLYRTEVDGDEPLVMVKLLNSTPEPDGSKKTYFLRVPPDMAMARQAVAWTFGMTDKEYAEHLMQQT